MHRGSSGSFKGLHSERSGGHRRVKSTEEAQELLGPSPDVLERYKSERAGTADPSLEELRGCMYEFCRDQHGSRFIQQKIAEASPKEVRWPFLFNAAYLENSSQNSERWGGVDREC